MWGDIAIGGGVIGIVGLSMRWLNTRMNRMEVAQKLALYQPNGQTNYIPRSECEASRDTFCDKIDDIKALLVHMDEKREEAKDDDHKAHRMIGERLAGIEAKLP